MFFYYTKIILLSSYEPHNVLYMVRMWKHIYRLNCIYDIIALHEC